jgi:NAD+ synthase (glutamine-hydrolysing)
MNAQSKIKIAAVQLNQVIGDFQANAARIATAAKTAFASGVRIVLTPELSLTAYPPEDLLLRPKFFEKCNLALEQLMADLSNIDIHVIVGVPVSRPKNGVQVRYNAALWLHKGRVVGEYFKRELPNYSVFDEDRYFESGENALVVAVDSTRRQSKPKKAVLRCF